MSHQHSKSKERIVVNHESLKQAVNSLFTAAVFRGVRVRKGCQWTARMLVTVALFWAWSAADGLKERFQGAASDVWLLPLRHIQNKPLELLRSAGGAFKRNKSSAAGVQPVEGDPKWGPGRRVQSVTNNVWRALPSVEVDRS